MNIVSTLKKFGVIQEMNDWKKHFTDGTRGQPKTDTEILDYVEELIGDVFQNNPDKVKNCRLAPWLIKTVTDIGFNNLTGDENQKFITVIQWFKKTGNDSKIKPLNLEQAFDLSTKGLTTTDDKDKNAPKTEIPEDAPHLEAEKQGRIKRVYSVNDGSRRIWVEVIDGKWLTENSELNQMETWGVRCQVGQGFTSSENQNIQLIGPPQGKPDGPWSTQVGMSGTRSSKGLREIKQEGNHQPGSQKTSAGYSDADERIIDFLCFSQYAKSNIQTIYTYGNSLPNLRDTSGAARFLLDVIRDKPNLLNKLADHREDIIENNKQLILEIKGQEWFDERNLNVAELAQNDPKKFLDRFDRLIDRFPEETIEQLKNIDLIKINEEEPDLILKNISSFIGRIPNEKFYDIFVKIDLDKFIKSYNSNFKELLKFVSNERIDKSKQEYQKIFKYLLEDKQDLTISAFGGGPKGFKSFMDFLESPRLRKHQNAFFDPAKKEYIAQRPKAVLDNQGNPVRDENNRTVYTMESFSVPDNLRVLDRKERKEFIEKNKDLLKSFIKGTEFEKNLFFLKFYTPQLSDQEIIKIFGQSSSDDTEENLKKKIIDYYTQKYKEFEEDRKMAALSSDKDFLLKKYGKDIKGQKIIKSFKPGILEFYQNFKFNKQQDNLIPLADLKKYRKELVEYFESTSTQEDPYLRRIDGFIKYLQLCKDNKIANEEIMKFIQQINIDPSKDIGLAYYFYSNAYKILNKKLAISEIKKLEDLFGEKNKRRYIDLVDKFSIKKYIVKKGDMIEFKGNGPDLPKLNLIRKKYLVIDVENSYYDDELSKEDPENISELNSFVKVAEESQIENGGKTIWVPSSRFDIKTTKIFEFDLNENFNFFSNKFNKLKNLMYENKKNNPKYSAVVLDEKSKSDLLNIIHNLKNEGIIGEDWTISADHITIQMGSLYDPDLLGKDVNIKVIGIGYNDMIVSLRVVTDVDINFSIQRDRIPHITLAYNKREGAKPVMGGKFEKWENFENLNLTGVIEEVY